MRLLRRNKSFTSKRSLGIGRAKGYDNTHENRYGVARSNENQRSMPSEARMEMGGAYSSRHAGAPSTPQEGREQPPPLNTVVVASNDHNDDYSVEKYNLFSDAHIDKALCHMDDAVLHVSTSISLVSHTTKTFGGTMCMCIEAVRDPCACNDLVTDVLFSSNNGTDETTNHQRHGYVDRYIRVPQRKKSIGLNISSNRLVKSRRSRSRSGRRRRVREEDRFAEC